MTDFCRFSAIGVLLVAGCGLGQKQAPPERATETSAKVTSPEELERYQIQRRPGHVGVIVAKDAIDVASTIDATVAEMVVGIGDRVVTGAPIAHLDEAPIREDLKMAKADLRVAGAQAKRAGISARAATKAYEAYKAAGDAFGSAQINSTKARAGEASATRSEALASATRARAQVERLKRMLTETTITAPFTGTISAKYIDKGELVNRGAAVVRLIASDELRVRFAVPIEDARKYQLGDRVAVKLETSDTKLGGEVVRLAPDLDPVAQMVTGEIALALGKDQRQSVRAGMGVRVSPTIDREPKQLD